MNILINGIEGMPFSKIVSSRALPSWLWVKVNGRNGTNAMTPSPLSCAIFTYKVAEVLRVLVKCMIVSMVLSLAGFESRLIALGSLLGGIALWLLTAVTIGDRPTVLLYRLHHALKTMPDPLEAGIFHLKAMTEEQLEDRIDAALSNLAYEYGVARSNGNKTTAERVYAQLQELLEISKDLGFTHPESPDYRKLAGIKTAFA